MQISSVHTNPKRKSRKVNSIQFVELNVVDVELDVELDVEGLKRML